MSEGRAAPLPVRSAMPGVVWPGIARGEDAAVLALLAQLQHAEYSSPQSLREHQDRQLRALCAHARGEVPFYRERLKMLGRALDLSRWHEVPILERAELQQIGPALRASRYPPEHGKTRLITTSGSTGMTVAIEKTAVCGLIASACILREHLWHARDFNGRLAAVRMVKDDPQAMTLPGRHVRGWGAGTTQLEQQGEGFLLDIHVPLGDQWQWLESIAPDYVLTYPSNLRAWLDLPQAARGLASLRHVKTIGELVEPELRARCRAVLGVPLIDEYSAQECGSIAIQCPRHDHYHVQAESVLVEVVDESGQACAPGSIGRVVVTPLHEFRTPLIRYALGDYAELGPACDCGRALPVLKRVWGRARNMITLPDGSKRWPLSGDSHYRAIAPISQFQFVQRTPTHFEVRLVVRRELTTDEETRFKAWVMQRFGYPFELDLVYMERIERGAGGKYEDFISHL